MMDRSGVAIVGAGRIGVPWGAVVAAELDVDVTCIDIDKKRIKTLNAGEAPFKEPRLGEYISRAVDAGTLSATTDQSAVADHRYVAFTINAPRNQMSEFLNVVREYAPYLDDDHVAINRVTLPVGVIEQMRETIARHADGDPAFAVFPERLAEGKAIEEIETLPKIVGVDDEVGRAAMQELLEKFGTEIQFTNPEAAMFVKLIDNSYRDALFSISNQIAYTADQLDLDAHEAIKLANHDYPRNGIPTPGPVGGKCLPKDPHFLTDERVCDQPTTPDLFNTTRRTNAYLAAYTVTQILRRQPSKVAMLGLSYKAGVGDTYDSPARDIADDLEAQGVPVEAYEPHVEGYEDLEGALDGADIVVLAVNHAEFEGIEGRINELTPPDAVVYDLWGVVNDAALERAYDGFGIATRPGGHIPQSTDTDEQQ